MNDVIDVTGAGLSDADAAMRFEEDGPNELPSTRPRGPWRLLGGIVREPMLLLLLGAGGTYVLLGDAAEALAIVGAIVVVIAITLYQENRTERTLFALRELSSPRALVVRSGVIRRIAGRDVVRGDLVILEEGARVPADAIVQSTTNLRIDESLLTGESVPVSKVRRGASVEPIAPDAGVPGGDDRPFVFSGTVVVAGSGMARVYATGTATAMGRIGRALDTIEIGRTRLQQEVSRVVLLLASIGLSVCALVAVVYGVTRGRWLDGVLAGLTTAIAMVPEEFPVVLTIFLALGAWRIAQHRVLTRRVPAIETLGAATVLCVDKTGTLTMNRMAMEAVWAADAAAEASADARFSEAERSVVESAARASRTTPFDPMERALVNEAARIGIPAPDPVALVREYPMSDDTLAMANVWNAWNAWNVWRDPSGGRPRAALKGAPETVAALCGLDEATTAGVMRRVERMAGRGLRVLGVARAAAVPDPLPDTVRGFTFDFLGLVGFADPVRPGVPDAIAECANAGIRVVMITGDYPATALHIAEEIGLDHVRTCLTGSDLTRMDDGELRRCITTVSVFARMVPEQKLRLVTVFKANGDVVAMTGDGVNDAPALKAADIGIAMGGRGTDVAREAGALVLLDDDFTSIVRTVRLGRRIYDNIRKAMSYVLAIHVPIAGMALLPVLFRWPLLLLPLHVIFMELIVDPACSIAFELEPEEADVMRRPPRPPAARLLDRRFVTRSLLQGAGALAVSAVVYLAARSQGLDERDVRTLTFTTLIIANLSLIFANRSFTRPTWSGVTGWRSSNPALWWLAGTALSTLGLILFVPALRDLFALSQPHAIDLAVCALAGATAVLWMEMTKKRV
ncbi:MAG: cation-translocating P-type ATPase [Acidobacteria bacterium]|nr:cation-translocating P-type ATPase [Acidobacteriota bacterium]